MNNYKVVFITAPESFRDEEYYIPKKILEKNTISVTTASTRLGTINGKFGFKALSTLLIQDVSVSNFDAIIYIGGTGADIFFNNIYALQLAKDFVNCSKITAAICIASVTLANSGVLKHKKATAFIDAKDILINHNAIYTGKDVEIDSNIITANGPDAAKLFGETIVKYLTKK
ncbi:MAG: DJ-1/PfpI family protein [Endomicrobium sp.]|jgi:protease I|nr:DJ-1/PfpI family protein [Endomicrobium sp.]